MRRTAFLQGAVIAVLGVLAACAMIAYTFAIYTG